MAALAATSKAAAAAHAEPFYLGAEFWLAIAFMLFVAAVAKPVAKMISEALDARSAKIQGELDEAEHLREEAQTLLATYERKQRDATLEAEDILAHAEAEARRLAETAARDLTEALKRREQLALDKIAQAEAQAIDEVRDAAIDLALKTTRELIVRNLDDNRAQALIEGAIKELPQKLQ